MRKFSIFFALTPAFNPNDGGVQRTTFKLGKKFTELGHTVTYFSFANKGNIEAEYGTLFHGMHARKTRNQKNIEQLIEVLNEVKPDFVINQMPYDMMLTKTLAQKKTSLGFVLLGCLRNSLFSFKNNLENITEQLLPKLLFKLVDNKIGSYLILFKHRKKHKKQLKDILDLHDRFILLTPPNRDELKYFVGDYKKHKVVVIPNSIPEVYTGTEKKIQTLLHVGRLNIQQKRSDLLMQFWEASFEKLPNWEFIIVGDGPYKETMEKEIELKKLPRIKLLGFQSPESWYKKASIFVMTSAYEGFPNVILEAQSYGCVPVAFKSYDAISWIVNEGKDALLFSPYDINKMSKATIDLANNSERLKEFSKASKINVSQFVIDEVAKQWMALFQNLLKVNPEKE